VSRDPRPVRVSFADGPRRVSRLEVSREDLPLQVSIEGRKEYVLRLTASGGLILNRKDPEPGENGVVSLGPRG
jgi:hypothetical protein